MRNFLLDTNPNFNLTKVVIENTTYRLSRVKDCGVRFSITEPVNGIDQERDSVCMTDKDAKALYMLLTVK